VLSFGRRRALEGRVVLVTGATGSLGSALAAAAAGAGASVVATGRDPERLEALARSIAEREDATPPLTVAADVRSEDDVTRLRDQALERFDAVDALVVAHGIGRHPGSPRALPHAFAHLPLAEWRALVDTNLTSVYLLVRALVPEMQRRGGGSVVLVGSARGGRHGQAFGAPYCASKFALRGFAETLADEVCRDGVRVTLLQPEAVRSPLIAATRLGAGRAGAMDPRHLGELVVALLAMPEGVRLPEPVFTAFPRGAGTTTCDKGTP